MVRKKSKDENARKAALLQGDILALLSSLHDMRVETETRRQMVFCLNKLSNSIGELSRTRDLDKASVKSDNALIAYQLPENNIGYSTLLQLEEAALDLRSVCDECIDMIETEQNEVSQINRELESLSGRHAVVFHLESSHYVQATLFIRKLTAQYQAQLHREEELVADIRILLSNMYKGGNEPGIMDPLDNENNKIPKWTQLINERPVLDKLLWNTLPLLIDNLQQKEDRIKAEDSSFLVMSTTRPREETCLQPSKADPQSVAEAVDMFLRDESWNGEENLTTFLLVVGEAGSGKTYLCDEIERRVSGLNASSSEVLLFRPSIPLDFMGSSVGETEDMLVSLFGSAQAVDCKCIVILDDIEHLLGDVLGNSMQSQDKALTIGEEPHVLVRSRSTLLGIMESSRQCQGAKEDICALGKDTLVVGTARNGDDDLISRFDRVIYLQPPDEHARKQMITSSLGLTAVEPGPSPESCIELQDLLSEVVEKTIGRSYAELAQYCRRGLSEAGQVTAAGEEQASRHIHVLRAMRDSLRSVPPESLRSGSLDDFVDINVYSARELLANEEVTLQLPLFGHAAEEAWRQMNRLFVTPLCRSGAFDEIMYGGMQSPCGTVRAGVLLTGPSGCGKSALAHHCAKVAASLLDSVTLIEVSCTSLVHKEVGGSERAVSRMFSAARAAAPCILLMDGIENIAAVRGNDNTTEGTMDRVLSTLLTELDGIDDQHDTSQNRPTACVAVIGITQLPAWIDPSLRRPGRLEKTIQMEPPRVEARRRIVLKQIQNLPLEFPLQTSEGSSAPQTHEDLAKFVVSSCQVATASELIALCHEASLVSARRHIRLGATDSEASISLSVEDFRAALEVRGK